MTDFHLDTSWCPVCECEIPPKRLLVPVIPPPQPTAVRSSQTMRGKHGTIKARSGLVQGTGRARPALNRASTKGKAPQNEQQFPDEPVRMRTVIDPEPTALYCSDACRLKDLGDEWPVASPPTYVAIEAPTSQRASRIQLGAHPNHINPARASPPPPSPIIPPVPPNSFRTPRGVRPRPGRELDIDELAACIQEEADEHSDSSSTTGTSFTASDRSPVEERDIFDNSNLYTDPQPPPLPPLPLHPHRPSAPVVPPGANRDKEVRKYDRGNMMAAKRLQELLASGVVDDEQTRAEKREREEKQRKEQERLRRWDFTGEMSRSSSNDREKKKQEELIDPLRWTEVIYQYSASSSSASSASPGIPSTHRRASHVDPSTKLCAPEVPNRSQSALELYAKYPLFARSSAGTSRTAVKSSASLAANYAPAYGVTSSSSVKTSTSSTSDRTAGASVSAPPGMDPELYVGKRRAGPRRSIPQGLEGKLVLPDVLLRPTVQMSSSLPSGSSLPTSTSSSGMRRSGSEANVAYKKTGRSASALGVVREGDEVEGAVWHRPQDGSEDSSSVTHSSTSGRSRRSRGKRTERPTTEATGPNYSSRGPLYDAVPPLPQTQKRFEEIFEPDYIPEGDSATLNKDIIRLSPLHKRDKEISRRAIREVGRRRGEHKGKFGWWVEKEWEVRAIPERKCLFLFDRDNA